MRLKPALVSVLAALGGLLLILTAITLVVGQVLVAAILLVMAVSAAFEAIIFAYAGQRPTKGR